MDDAIDVSPNSSILSPLTLVGQRKHKQTHVVKEMYINTKPEKLPLILG